MATRRYCFRLLAMAVIAVALTLPASVIESTSQDSGYIVYTSETPVIKVGIVKLSCAQNTSVIRAGMSHTYQINVTNNGLATDTINLTIDNPTSWRAHFNENDPYKIPTTGGASSRSTTYRNYTGCVDEIYAIEAAHPDIVNVTVIGASWEGRDIHCIKVSDNVTLDEGEPEILIMGMHHAREWMTVEVPMYYLNHLVDNYGSDARATWMINNREIFLVPIVNPDGYVYSQEVQNMWRKNRRDNGGGIYGVDLNRNYDGAQNGDPDGDWGGAGASHTPTSDTYCGPVPFSEPETQAIRDIVLARDFKVTLSYHSYGREVYWPWGYSTSVQTPHDPIQKAIAEGIADINGYTAMQSAAAYPTTGDTDDWVYGHNWYNLGRFIAANTIELDGSFQPAPSQIDLTCALNLDVNYYSTGVAGNLYQDSPVISHTPLEDTTNTTGPYTVSVDITTAHGLLPGATKLFWKTTGSWNEELMTNVVGDTWEADIPGQVDTWIYYYVETEDINFNKASEPKYTPYAYHLFHVGADATEYSLTLASAEWQIVNFAVEAPETALPDEEAKIDVIGTSEGTPSDTDSVETVTRVKPGILLVNDENSEIANYRAALENNGYAYVETLSSTLFGRLDDYDVVIWATDGSTPLDSNERDNIDNFLTGGGNLYINGEDIGWAADDQGWLFWYNAYLHADYLADDTNALCLNGVPGDEITDGMSEYLITGDYPSRIAPLDASASTIFQYVDGTGGIAGIKADTGVYRLVYIACEYFEGSDSNLHKNLLMHRIIEWLSPIHTFDVPLSSTPGWNLISIPLTRGDVSLNKVLESIDGDWNCAQTYDTITNTWMSSIPTRPDTLNDLETLDHTVGFWVNISKSEVNLAFTGRVPSSTSIPLYAGWNLVGYPTLNETVTVVDAFWGTGVDKVMVFDALEPYRIKEIGPTYVMKPGEGYWVHVTVDSNWIVNW